MTAARAMQAFYLSTCMETAIAIWQSSMVVLYDFVNSIEEN
jgi:hypothetical protein